MNPFAALTEPPRARLLKTAVVDVRISGQRVTDARLIPEDDPEEKARLAKLLAQAKARARYQRDRKDPEKMAKRKAWLEANREKVKAYKAQYDKENRKAMRTHKLNWQLRAYRADPEKFKKIGREYYAKNREAILARLAAKRAAAKAARAGGRTST